MEVLTFLKHVNYQMAPENNTNATYHFCFMYSYV